MPKKILFIVGSLNQTEQAHAVGQQLEHEYDCYYTHYYGDKLVRLANKVGLLNNTVLGKGSHFYKQTEAYVQAHHLPMDNRGERHHYDLIVTTSDLIIQDNIKDKPIILIQEGMTDPEKLTYQLVRRFHLPRYIAGTAANGLSDEYDLFCVASEGYKQDFVRKGARPEKMIVTGMPNYDHAAQFYENDFPHHNFVLAATSDARETWKFDHRKKFIRRCVEIANGRLLIFKLHPNEKVKRAVREIQDVAPDALIFTDGNVDEMIANCDVLITQYSTVVYTGIALGKEVHSYFDVDKLKQLAPWQNGHTSAQRIAHVCRTVLEEGVSVAKEQFVHALA